MKTALTIIILFQILLFCLISFYYMELKSSCYSYSPLTKPDGLAVGNVPMDLSKINQDLKYGLLIKNTIQNELKSWTASFDNHPTQSLSVYEEKIPDKGTKIKLQASHDEQLEKFNYSESLVLNAISDGQITGYEGKQIREAMLILDREQMDKIMSQLFNAHNRGDIDSDSLNAAL